MAESVWLPEEKGFEHTDVMAERSFPFPLAIIPGLVLGGLAGAGVGLELYPPAVGVSLGVVIGIALGLVIFRARKRRRSLS